MNHLEDIFKKATVSGIADYLQFGLAPQKETRDYNTRLDEAYDKFEKAVCQHDKESHMNLLDLANDMENEAGSVYLEVGIQAGILLAKDMTRNISTETLNMCKEINYQDNITLDLYTHVTNDKAKSEMDKLQNLYQEII